MEKYQEIYDAFMAVYAGSETTPSQVGEVLARIAGLYPNYNTMAIKLEHAFDIVHKGIAESTDEGTGKNISSSKAGVLADATIEALGFKEAKAHVINIEMLVGALKFLQKSLEVEYINSGI